ncbi:gliding motility-associated C-terminal domain-containing protein [Chitinophaga barathri]|nr:gliding motility-associated C-terminal domain-containing protein [Chitinophaga barathri]
MYRTVRTTYLILFSLLAFVRVYAEGSKELSANGGSRAFWRCSGTSTAQFPYPNPGIIRVYANVGERIYLGSSAQGINGGTISWVAPNGATGSSGNSATVGLIPDRAAELLGPRLTTNGADPGYNPYIVTVGAGQAGIWEITFTSTSTTAAGTTPIIPANGAWTQNINSVYLAAFDVSVRNGSNTAFIPGRSYLHIFSGNTASVGATFGSFNGIFYVLTRDGFEYSVNANGMQGVAFQFFVNNKGFRDGSGNSAYSSVAGIGTTPGTIPVHNPTTPDDATNVTHKLFFNQAAADMPASAPIAGGGTVWLLTTPIDPTLSTLTFTGREGTPNATGTFPLGGTFTFNSTAVGAYRLSLDVNQNGIFTDVQDRVITGFSVIGTNSVPWDALDGEGNPVPGGTTFAPGSIKVEMLSGEVHFPLLDVERNPAGIIVTRITGAGAPNNILYWDDTNIPVVGTPSNPVRNLAGQPSNTNGHTWNLNFGDNNGMDSWSYISSDQLFNTAPLEVREADLEVVAVTADNPSPCVGSPISYTIHIRNNGPSDVTGATFLASVPPPLLNPTFEITATGTASATNPQLFPAGFSADLNMESGSSLFITISGTSVSLAGTTLTVDGRVMRIADCTDPDATNPDAAPPTDGFAECDAPPSGTGCNNIKSFSHTITGAIGNNVISSDQSLCENATPATLTGTVPTGGTGVFTYLWEMSTTSDSEGFAPAPGTNNTINYSPGPVTGNTWFRRTVISGCNSQSNLVTITTSPPSASGTVTPPTCTVATGSIVAPEVPGNTFSLNGSAFQTSGTFAGLAPGNYTLIVQNTDGCVSNPLPLVIPPQPATPAAPAATVIPPTCLEATGSITVTTIAGLEYSINGTDYQAYGTFVTLTPGTYSLTARNADGCISTATSLVIPAQPATPAAPAATVTPPTCTVATGTITVTEIAGLEYSINEIDFQASGTFTNVAPGTYSVTARNTDGCVSTATSAVIPAQPPTPGTPAATVTPPTCTVATGTITVTVIAGLEYSINGTDYQASGTFSNAAPGTYSVTARSADGCVSTATSAVIPAQPPTPTAPAVSLIQPTCTVTTGTITVTTIAGLEYSINGTDYQASGTFANVATGTYSVTARNTDGCTSPATPAVIGIQPPTPAAPVANITAPTCTVATGTITVTYVEGMVYSINGTDFQNNGVFANVAPGTYTVTVRNTNGCTATANAVVPAQPATPAAPAINITAPTCTVATGTITVTVIAGLEYSINGTDYQASGTFSNAAPGTYSVTARSADGCVSTATSAVIPAQPPTPTAPAVSLIQPTCTVTTGTITVTTIAGLEYSINGTDYQASGTFANVTPGTYSVTARNADGCTSTATSAVIPAQPATPAAPIATVTPPTCTVATGTITVTEIAGLEYSINGMDYQASGTFVNVAPGTYSVTARNADGCTSAAASAVIPAQPSTPAAPVVTVTAPTCTVATGTITVTEAAGLTYSINGTDYQASGTFTNVLPGTYSVTTRNSDGCTSTASSAVIPAQPASPAAPAANVTAPTCTVATGTISVTEVAGLTYSINGTDYQPSGTFAGIAQGSYNITARNSDGCTSTATQAVVPAQPPAPAAPVVAITAPTCTITTGSITVTETAGLTYSINGTDYQATGIFTNLAPGTYNVSVRNTQSCTSTATTAMIPAQPATPAAPVISITAPTCTVATGTITVTASAGLTYSINGTDYQASATFTNVTPGTYSVTARNADGCTSTATSAVIPAQPASPAAPVVNVTAPTCAVATGKISATMVAGMTYSINGTDYQPSGTFAGVAPGSYNVTARDASGCTSTATSAVVPAQPAVLPAPAVAAISYCQGDAATPLQAGGTLLKWYNSETGGVPLAATPVPNTATPGIFTFWVSQSNAAGCESLRNALVVTVFAKPTPQITSSTADMNSADARRELTATPAGGIFSGNGVVTENGRAFFNPATAGAGSHTLTYTYTSGGNCSVSTTFVIRVTAAQVDVSVRKISDAQAVRPNDVYRYTITATNNSTVAAPDVVVTDVLPATLSYQSHTVTTGTAAHSNASNTLTWNIASLAPGASETLVITVTARSTGNISNSVNIVSGLADASPGNNTSTDNKEIVDLKVPNIFTPDGDGMNDRFVIKGLELYQQNQLTIINRWGNHVFEQKNYSNTWEATGLLEGTYYYLLKLTDRQGKETVLKGYITIFRGK